MQFKNINLSSLLNYIFKVVVLICPNIKQTNKQRRKLFQFPKASVRSTLLDIESKQIKRLIQRYFHFWAFTGFFPVGWWILLAFSKGGDKNTKNEKKWKGTTFSGNLLVVYFIFTPWINLFQIFHGQLEILFSHPNANMFGKVTLVL